MLLYEDILTGDEVASDAFPLCVLSHLDCDEPLIHAIALSRREVEGIVFEVEAALITIKEGAVQVNNVVHSHRLQRTTFDKKSYLTYLKVPSHPHPLCRL